MKNYVKPLVELIELDVESAILAGSSTESVETPVVPEDVKPGGIF